MTYHHPFLKPSTLVLFVVASVLLFILSVQIYAQGTDAVDDKTW